MTAPPNAAPGFSLEEMIRYMEYACSAPGDFPEWSPVIGRAILNELKMAKTRRDNRARNRHGRDREQD